MATECTIREIYDIAAAFITDRNTSVKASDTDNGVSYRFTKPGLADYPYQLIIYIPRGAPERLKLKGSYVFGTSPLTGKLKMRWNQPYKTDKKQGEIRIQRGTGTNFMGNHDVVSAKTKHNVGRANDKTQCDIVQGFTRMLSPRFFELVQMAENRLNNKIKTTDNTTQMFNMLYRIQNENQK